MPKATPAVPDWIREFTHPGYVNGYSFDRLRAEPKLFATETLFGDWDAQTLLLAKDAAPADVIRAGIERGDPNPWRHGERGRDPMGYSSNAPGEWVWLVTVYGPRGGQIGDDWPSVFRNAVNPCRKQL